MFCSSEIESIEKAVKSMVALVFKADEGKLNRKTRFLEDLFAKSIQTLELLAMMEYKFEIEIPLNEVRNNRTIGQAIDYVVEKLKENEK
jgi:acyl carrier protein